jgi:hypothetical protein
MPRQTKGDARLTSEARIIARRGYDIERASKAHGDVGLGTQLFPTAARGRSQVSRVRSRSVYVLHAFEKKTRRRRNWDSVDNVSALVKMRRERGTKERS